MTNKLFINPRKEEWPLIVQRPSFDSSALETTVSSVLKDVQQNGDAAVKKYSMQFDKVELKELKVTEDAIIESTRFVDAALKEAIRIAGQNIRLFHQSQQIKEPIVETIAGVRCWRKSVAIQKVGLYIPGGTAPLFSTLLMLGIPAVLAGCKEIIVCTPCDKEGNINPVIRYVAHEIGLQNIYAIGGVQAIAAMAYGTASVPKVDKIFGPGNRYVTCAKQLVNKDGVAIDMPAGPSEVAVYADESCHPVYVAADLLSQAEHGTDSQVMLVASDEHIIAAVKTAMQEQLSVLPRNDIATIALSNSRFVVMEDTSAAFDLLNEYAAEHLIISSDNAAVLAEKVINAGSVFLGHYSPESVGDYASGTNHTLPTGGFAKVYSGVSMDSFVKKITFQQLTESGLQSLAATVENMAAAEGLDAHKNAVAIRLKNSGRYRC